MNQILFTEKGDNRGYKKNGGTKDVRSVAKFFAFAIFIFGIILIATSSFALYKNTNNKEKNVDSKPIINVEKIGEDELAITVTHEGGEIKNVVYYWNQGNKTTIDGKNEKVVKKTIQIPSGSNILHITSTDSNNNTSEYSKEYLLDGDIKIDITVSGNNVKIVANGVNNLKNVSYNWDNEEPKTVDINDKTYSLEVQAIVGEHTFNVTAIDSENNSQDKTIKVIGTTKPTIKIEKGDNCYLISAHDDIALKKVEIVTVNDGKKITMVPDDKDFSYPYPLKDGDDNYIRVVAYNTQGEQSKVIGAKWKK